jgi:hypothetical protein
VLANLDLRTACTCSSTSGSCYVCAVCPAGFPGRQQASYQDNFCLRKACYDHVLVYDDFTKVTGTSTEDTAAGERSHGSVAFALLQLVQQLSCCLCTAAAAITELWHADCGSRV